MYFCVTAESLKTHFLELYKYDIYVNSGKPGLKLALACLVVFSNDFQNIPSCNIKYQFGIRIVIPVHKVC